jgi:uncharacterized protein YutE (UPF0331/DUF86 family)
VLRVEFVRRKLQLITDELGRLTQFRDIGYDELIGDPLRLAAIERLLERIVLRAIDVNEHLIAALSTAEEDRTTRLTYRDTFLRLVALGVYEESFAQQIARSAGLRNILVHEYNDVDHRILHAAIPQALEQYHTYVSAVNRFLDRRQ